MSQHTFDALDGKVLLTGYDRNCGEFHYSIFAWQSTENQLHWSATDPEVDATQLTSIRSRVIELMPGVPEAIWTSVLDDAKNDVGNRIVHWTSSGQIKFDSEAHAALSA